MALTPRVNFMIINRVLSGEIILRLSLCSAGYIHTYNPGSVLISICKVTTFGAAILFLIIMVFYGEDKA
jgi:hypothetical protein